LIPAELIGTIPGWITSISVVTLVIGFWRHRAALAALANARDADIRGHYADELERVIKRQHDCENREEALRDRVAALEDEVTGLKRQIIRYSADAVAFLEGKNCPSTATPHAAASAERVSKIMEGK
jgi:septal ring factor EnvC (AmiA/AmiB activator)